ncbi:carboxypeptidase-like regulatory domain-containing protein [Psychroserpens burtonensis]|uniref:Carboxypeptidase-like regulatory domain-containing protein n=1 Tax=Psychroserpens burtonensis TaxID=49278 RepID=A0A5C7BB98_9FLAO|nr:hypothetical protein [Psychroserpens burtonensis]TXE17493.1 carboxypeptidase-like regulatory domain-containing protein [Psychroserpens burtonensis]
MKYLTILLFTASFTSNAQTISGFIYDHESTIKGVKLINITQNILTYSNESGQFKIGVKHKDTLTISSYFHSQQTIILSQDYFEEEIVIELQKTTNALDEVKVTKILEKKFDSIVLTTEIKNQLPNDIKADLIYTEFNPVAI